MKLQDVSIGQDLELEVVWGENKYMIPTQAVGSSEDGLLIRPIVYNKTVIELGYATNKDMVFNLHSVNKTNGSREAWRSLSIKTIKYRGELFYAVKTSQFNMNATSSERRQHVRMKIDAFGQLDIGNNEGGIPIHVIDFSDNGISFTTPTNVMFDKTPHTVYFSDSVRDNNFDLKIKCSWARRAEHEEGILWGCTVSDLDRKVLAYICLRRAQAKAMSN